jgi:glycosyltransferase involved in cell wall biosynthesis
MKKLAIITTHPIQYNAPWFRLLAERNQIQIKVFYTWSQSETGTKYDPGFGKNIEWDIPLLDGYEYEFVRNIATNPGTRTHSGIVNPQLIERIKQYHPDAILINGWNFNSHLKCLRYFHKKITVLFRGDSILLDEQKGIRKVLRQIVLKWVYGNVDYALYTGKQNKKYFLRHGLKEDQLIFVPHAIDNERFASNDTNKKVAAGFRKKLMIPDGDTIFLFAGKLERKKDPQILIDAFKTICNPAVHLILVGNGELEKELQQSAVEFANMNFWECGK